MLLKAKLMRQVLRKPKNFSTRNGGLLLEELITVSSDGKHSPLRMFSKEELHKATNTYHENGVCFRDTNYNLFKGTHDGRPIFIKKMVENEDEVDYYISCCIREIAIASQITGHSNILNILGCCLETKVPILVFEYASTGFLSEYLYKMEEDGVDGTIEVSPNVSLPWQRRLRIAIEVGEAIAYLHMAKSQPIIHRHVKSDNILLDVNLRAKLFDFGLSPVIPPGETHVDAEVEGTTGYIAPESVRTGQFTEKSDVFGFGAVLLELLTGQEVYDIYKEASSLENGHGSFSLTAIVNATGGMTPEQSNDYMHHVPLKEALTLYLKSKMVKDGESEQRMACAYLAGICVAENPQERPTMKEVVQELRGISKLGSD
ncbi:hypothetical protein K2173_011560 [Erythroxylum novogranatense]|uniref:Protein kinase domain-containing protein n=1 Tax=Erythroxylum novogranatense TaxID=1862640 RepID=A0AAV8S5C1_9ROSI|nr:hypothetical protein K2173_011560 [Erythroxylum novogranatense]